MDKNALVKGTLALLNEEPPTPEKWVESWRELASVTNGIMKGDPQFNLIMRLLEVCDKHFSEGDWTGFQAVALRIKNLCHNTRDTVKAGTVMRECERKGREGLYHGK